MTYTLAMTFLTESGEKSTFSISDVREDVSNEEVQALMNTIIENNVFINKKGDYVAKESAALTQKETTKFEV